MSPSMVHVNGSVNFADTETVMRELATRVPSLRRIPDGERGPERELWLNIQEERFRRAGGLVSMARNQTDVIELQNEQFQLAEGISPEHVRWPDLGYAHYYLESWKIFQKLVREGVVSADARFQVQYPTPLAVVSSFMIRDQALVVYESYAKALFADLQRLMDAIPPARLAVQWDIPYEIGVLECPEFFAVSDAQNMETVARGVAQCINVVPRSIPTGLHVCYGDAEHRHFKEPADLSTQVLLVNSICAMASRPVSWAAFTVPQYASAEDFFAPLRNLTTSLEEPYLALVPYHPGKQESGVTQRQVQWVNKYLPSRQWGICTECGLANVARDELQPLLDLHTQILRS